MKETPTIIYNIWGSKIKKKFLFISSSPRVYSFDMMQFLPKNKKENFFLIKKHVVNPFFYLS